jgi:hypothetical protein
LPKTATIVDRMARTLQRKMRSGLSGARRDQLKVVDGNLHVVRLAGGRRPDERLSRHLGA